MHTVADLERLLAALTITPHRRKIALLALLTFVALC